nr:GATA transcription factor 1-like [Ipomoea batatas]
MKLDACFMVDGDDLLNFTLDDGEGEKNQAAAAAAIGTSPVVSSSLGSSKSVNPDDFPEDMEEELEWLSNKDAFPGVETCFDIFGDNPLFDHKSPVSVLENSSSTSNSNSNSNSGGNGMISCYDSLRVPVTYPTRPRSKNRKRREAGIGYLPARNCLWVNHVKNKNNKKRSSFKELPATPEETPTIGRRCQHCGVDKTPQWRAGPMGPKTLCNACGVRYKSGRLLPEYRPANSPTFSAAVHSNSHRKVLEMRRQRMGGKDGIPSNEACGYRVASGE